MINNKIKEIARDSMNSDPSNRVLAYLMLEVDKVSMHGYNVREFLIPLIQNLIYNLVDGNKDKFEALIKGGSELALQITNKVMAIRDIEESIEIRALRDEEIN